MSGPGQIVLDADAISRTIRRMASAIVEQTQGASRLSLVGIRRGGVPLSKRLAEQLEVDLGRSVPVGSVDIGFYRDDAATALPDPEIGPSEVPFDVSGSDLVLVDDVLHTGRTVRAAIDALLDYGRPRRIWLAALFDRGGRELPIAADFVGRSIEVAPDTRLRVSLTKKGREQAAIEPLAFRTRGA